MRYRESIIMAAIRSLGAALAVIFIMVLIVGCAKKIDSKVLDSADNLYGYQLNYSNGTALLNIIPVDMVKDVYDNYDQLTEANYEKAPVMLREYAVTNTVYLDYDTDCSIVWEKDTGAVTIQKTDVAEREAYREKAHK